MSIIFSQVSFMIFHKNWQVKLKVVRTLPIITNGVPLSICLGKRRVFSHDQAQQKCLRADFEADLLPETLLALYLLK